MKKKLFGIALCVLLFVGALVMSASALDEINYVAFTGLNEPAPEANMDFDATPSSESLYNVAENGQAILWYYDDGGETYTWSQYNPPQFVEGREYRVRIYVEPTAGNVFPEDLSTITAFINDTEATIHKDSNGYFLQKYFDPCGSIESIVINCPAPVAGQLPSFDKLANYRYTSKGTGAYKANGITWYDETGKKHLIKGTGQKFESHHVYSVTFELESEMYTVQTAQANVDKYYEFTGNTKATVNGKAASVDLYENGGDWIWANVKYTFGETGCAPEFVEGEFPSCNGTGHVGYFACSCGKWYWDAEGTNPVENKDDILIPPTGAHNYKTTVSTKATLSKNGKTVEKCSCGAVKSNSEKTVYYPKTIKLEYTSATYNGKTKTPSVTVKDSKGKTLKKDTDYTVKYASGRKSTGKYSVTITFKGKYSGTKTLYFNILPSKTSKITPTCSTTEIKASWKSVTGASGYKVELLNSKGKVVKKVTTTKTSYTFKKLSKVTTYKIRVTAYKTIDKKAAYSTSSTTITTSTAPAKVTLSKVTAGSKSATPAWKTVSGASGYQVMYSTSSKFKSAKTATVKKGSSKKTTIKKLTKGKKYYFKVRAYKTVDGKKIYGAWSSVKSVKIK